MPSKDKKNNLPASSQEAVGKCGHSVEVQIVFIIQPLKSMYWHKCIETIVCLCFCVVVNMFYAIHCYATITLTHTEISQLRPLFSIIEQKERKTAGGWRLIFKRFHWIPAPALHTEEGFLSRPGLWTLWPPCRPPSHNTPCPPSQPPNIYSQPIPASNTKPSLHPNTSPSCFIHFP